MTSPHNHLLKRNRLRYGIVVILVVALGLFSRSALLRTLLPLETGDLLYAIMCYVGIAFLFNQKAPHCIAALALSFCVFIELTQLIEISWFVAIRQTKIGALIFGNGFLWVDLIAYTLGVLIAYCFEILFLKRFKT